MHARPLVRSAAALLCILSPACKVEGSVKASSANEARAEPSETTTAPAPAPAPAPTPAAPVAPPADACPLTCFEARGSERASVTLEEQTQLRTSLEPVLGRMRGCTSPED